MEKFTVYYRGRRGSIRGELRAITRAAFLSDTETNPPVNISNKPPVLVLSELPRQFQMSLTVNSLNPGLEYDVELKFWQNGTEIFGHDFSGTTGLDRTKKLLFLIEIVDQSKRVRFRDADFYTGYAGASMEAPDSLISYDMFRGDDAAKSPQKADAEYVWYGTNRKPQNPSEINQGFSNNRDTVIRYGRCHVFVPATHKIGSLGSGWWRRLVHGDDRLKLLQTEHLATSEYWKAIAAHLAAIEKEERHAVVFIHGYNIPECRVTCCANWYRSLD